MEPIKTMKEVELPKISLEEFVKNLPTEDEAILAKRKHLLECRDRQLKVITPESFQETDKHRLLKIQLTDALNWAKHMTESKLNLCLAGETGVGKTRTAWEAIKLRFRLHGGEPFAIGAESFTRRLFREPHLMDKVCNAKLLLLDDLGKEKTTPTSESAIFEVIRERMDNKRPTIYTTNFTPKTLTLRFQQVETGEAIARRLKESCHVIVYGN
jgi:DNA replication protein DnaC